jgi:amidase
MTAFAEYPLHDGLGLAELVRNREVSAAELVEAAIDRIEAHNPRVNAVIRRLYESARQTALQALPPGPFSGVPFLVKDLLATVAGVPTGNGNRLLQNITATEDSELVRRWKRTGVIILGKTNTPEFGLTPYTEPETFGPTRNPWDLTRTPGGSSGGSGAAVATRMVPIASGGDGGGSIRIPASACGLFGLKPTRGRTPAGPVIGESWHGFAIEHVLTRSVRDSAAMLDATLGEDCGAPYCAPPQVRPYLQEVSVSPGRLRIAFTGKPLLGHGVHAEVLEGLAATAKLLTGLGHEVVEATPPVDREPFALALLSVLAGEARADIEEAAQAAGRRVSVTDFEPATFALGMIGKALSAQEYASAVRYLQTAARRIARFFEGYDLLLTPTLSQPPVAIGALQLSSGQKRLINLIGHFDGGGLLKAMGIVEPLAARTFEFIPWTPVFNVTGQPAMSVPLHWSAAGLPIGMQFVARFGDEAALFRLAGQLEQAVPWFAKLPTGF